MFVKAKKEALRRGSTMPGPSASPAAGKRSIEGGAQSPLFHQPSVSSNVQLRASPDFDAVAEFQRQGVPSSWRSTDVNRSYSLCPTYPGTLFVPDSISDDIIRKAAAFRSKSRLPVLSWYCAKGGNAICRSSQPLVGITGNCSVPDQDLVDAIRTCTGSSDSRCPRQ